MAVVTDGIRGALRIGQTLSVLGRTGVDWLRGDRPPAPRMLRQTFERLGATYIKLGQFIASSPTFFPKEYVDEFQYCLDRTPSLPFGEIRKLIARELDQPLETVFSHIEPTALASASIAQVHGARLVTGERVVIKVQKPGVETTLGTDLNFLSLSARIIDTLAPNLSWASLSSIAREIQHSMMEECDFHQEAANLKAFRQFLEATDNQAVTVPRVYEHCSTRRILTMERFDGVPLTDLDSVRQVTADPEGTLISAMNTWFSSLTRCEFFHADVHAGNLMVLQDGRVGFIDFGIVGRIRPETWLALRDFGSTFLAQDFNGMADAMTRIGVTGTNVDRQALARDLQRLAQQLESPSENPSRVEEDVNELLMEVVRVGENHGLHFPREFALLLKQFLYFDRYVHILAPGMDMLKDERLTLMH
ncbi:ABC1 kinase family protein [Marinobacter persicus]|uniref:Unusual protein kinase regulating ubiquinone biosynthesis (AarF/ABC1/UbiB family) n=1 Tax=Marinobacter persicus TaxID=930118 RepID=A0A2S6G3B7_9GAMM|nr:AarF/UbiB family protein [Marinobacter persicus]PPK51134.1 putative unusual protein kinase regulating ubiquinone biosynthesis (AarF/ABC1/UbiB family) [Marinobacter persicus]PPK53131.1 putative unusual protein kinase regulating ubiquinone biosynthesis (AarF/ABC1/UbiB family) [Marinobacter persicus]PPK57733.1 putative unusual protein kinase regulating ubiquinone biosynthesis (AarF/ABC1/UbiB family) [Marinobacter persicus]